MIAVTQSTADLNVSLCNMEKILATTSICGSPMQLMTMLKLHVSASKTGPMEVWLVNSAPPTLQISAPAIFNYVRK